MESLTIPEAGPGDSLTLPFLPATPLLLVPDNGSTYLSHGGNVGRVERGWILETY